jgi:hypothetical protein
VEMLEHLMASSFRFRGCKKVKVYLGNLELTDFHHYRMNLYNFKLLSDNPWQASESLGVQEHTIIYGIYLFLHQTKTIVSEVNLKSDFS